MLTTILVLLIVLWLLGMVSSYTLGGFIHILLIIGIACIRLCVMALVMKRFKLSIVDENIFERCLSRHHSSAGNTGGKIDIVSPLIFVFNKADRLLGIYDQATTEGKPNHQEQRPNTPENNAHTS